VREWSDVAIGLEEVQDLGRVRHPEGQVSGIAVVGLDDSVNLKITKCKQKSKKWQ
jgi:hypothetical protein